MTSPVYAQIIPDNTLEVNSRVAPGCTACMIEGGTVRGSNLFHSFSKFSVPTGGEAFFNNATQIQNIFTRVTGNSASNIDGMIRANGTANLFLINPNGIVFNSNASLNIGGSFIASTGSAVKFIDGTVFSTRPDTATTPLLTISVPIGLQYGMSSGNIQVQGSGLAVQPSNTLALLGGNVAVEGGALGASGKVNLSAPGGRIELGGVVGNNLVRLVPTDTSYSLSYENVKNFADVSIADNAWNDVRAGGGGSITINAQNIEILSNSALFAGIGQGLGSIGAKAGDITLNATRAIKIVGSNVTNFVNVGSVGNAGNITVTARSIAFDDGTELGSITFGKGKAGDVNLTVTDALSLAGLHNHEMGSGIASEVAPKAVGDGGNIRIRAGYITLDNGAFLDTSSFGDGNAGDINLVVTDRLSLAGFDGFTGSSIQTSVEGGPVINQGHIITIPTAMGRGGNITITARSITLDDGAFITSGTWGEGNAGNITLTATDTLSLSGLDNNGLSSQIRSRVQRGAVGDGGNIRITVGSIALDNDASLSASSQGQGVAGDIDVQARSINLDAAAITAETASGQGGNISLQNLNLLLLRNGSTISTTAGTAEAGGNGGDITIDADLIAAIPKENSDIRANAFSGQGGNIRITTQGIFGIEPRSGETQLSDITASSRLGVNGVVQVNTLDVNPSQGLTALPTNIIDTSQLIANSCIARNKRPEGKFIITGNGGLPVMPDDPSIAPYQTYQIPTVQSASISTSQENALDLENPTTSNKPDHSVKSAPLIEAQGWMYGANGEVILTASATTVSPHGFWSKFSTCSGS
ncbi:two-partner secretion domain-containing protein [Nostoc sp.]|uniref:two-partner secretion domain-containing protein n=1 Tax=Nostoc sp. TaxID=1180 RepID=UPI002FFA66AE